MRYRRQQFDHIKWKNKYSNPNLRCNNRRNGDKIDTLETHTLLFTFLTGFRQNQDVIKLLFSYFVLCTNEYNYYLNINDELLSIYQSLSYCSLCGILATILGPRFQYWQSFVFLWASSMTHTLVYFLIKLQKLSIYQITKRSI